MTDDYAARAIAFFLPQFHPIPENDEWWGPGFTEWTNAAKARPLYPGHRQPTLPADLGFYDLRLPETREAQSALAERYGVEAFCYWHYWFGGGRRVLETPFTEVLASGEPSVSFCLGWANQTWTGIWHGAADRVLMEQTYPGAEDDQAPLRRDRRRRSATSATSGSTAGRCSTSSVPRSSRTPRSSSTGGSRWRGRPASTGSTSWRSPATSSAAGRSTRGGEQDGFDSSVYIRLPVRTEPRDVAAMRARRKLLRGLEVYPYAREPLPMPGRRSTPTTTCRRSTPTGTTRRARAAAAWRSTAPRRRSSARTSARPSTRSRPGRPTSGCSGSSPGTSGPRATTSSRTCEFGHGWLQVLHEELRRGR